MMKNQLTSVTSMRRLNNGVEIPCVGYGTFRTPESVAKQSVMDAIDLGYRHIDTAAVYENEVGVGQGIAASDVAREDLFVTSKLWNTERGYEKTKAAFQATLDRLKLDYLDLYLIHWPANEKQFGQDAEKLNAETWRAMEDLYNEGKIRAIGVSNFLPHHVKDLMKTAQIKPSMKQWMKVVSCRPYSLAMSQSLNRWSNEECTPPFEVRPMKWMFLPCSLA